MDRLSSSAGYGSNSAGNSGVDYPPQQQHYQHYVRSNSDHHRIPDDTNEMDLSSRDATPTSENGDEVPMNHHHHSYVTASSLQLLGVNLIKLYFFITDVQGSELVVVPCWLTFTA
jgi:hypothetical protein